MTLHDLESRSGVIQGHTFWRHSKASVRLYIGRCNYISSFRSIVDLFGDIAGFIRPSQLCKKVSSLIKCTSAYVRLTGIMHPAILHSVGVITKLYFVIFEAFKESITLNLAQRSSKVIDLVPIESAYIFLLVANSNVDPILHRFRDTVA